MNKLSDELLNKYIDKELSQAELQLVKNILENSESERKKLKALQLVHDGLKNLTQDQTSPGFTSIVMNKLTKKSKAKKEQRNFILSISSIFITISLGIIGYFVYILVTGPSTDSGSLVLVQDSMNTLKYITDPIKNLLSGKNIEIIGSVFSLGLLISVYFLFESIKQNRHNLGKQH